jgi:TatD DNase family protein
VNTTSLYVDSHCHIDRFDDPAAVLASAERAGVVTVAVTELPSDFQLLAAQLRGTQSIRVALGFHPLKRPQNPAHELSLFSRLLDRTDYVGEVGLDSSEQGRATLREQRDVFEHLLALPKMRRKVLTVHSRRAEKDTIKLLADAKATAVLHWYSGQLGPIEHALAAGFYFSVNPAMVRSRNGRRIIEALPRERVVTETDGPYTRVGGRAAEPRDVPGVVAELGRVWGLTPDEARQSIYDAMGRLHTSALGAATQTVDEDATPAQHATVDGGDF